LGLIFGTFRKIPDLKLDFILFMYGNENEIFFGEENEEKD
jgi:hypothetical protein